MNVAGGALGVDTVAEADLGRWQRMYDMNVLGTLRLTKAVLPHFGGEGGDLLRRARGQLSGASALALEDSDTRMSRLGRSELTLGEFADLDETLRRIDAVTTASVRDLAAELVDHHNPAGDLVVGEVVADVVFEIAQHEGPARSDLDHRGHPFAEALVDAIDNGSAAVAPSHIAEALDFLWEGFSSDDPWPTSDAGESNDASSPAD